MLMTKKQIDKTISEKINEFYKKKYGNKSQLIRDFLIVGIRQMPGEENFMRSK